MEMLRVGEKCSGEYNEANWIGEESCQAAQSVPLA